MCWKRSSRASAWRWPRVAGPAGEGRAMAEKSVVRTEQAPGPFQGAPYSQAIRAGGFVFVSGQLGLKLGDEGISGSIAEQTEQIFANMRAILEAAGSSLDRLVKTTVFLVDLNEFAAMNEVYARHVGDAPPARSTVEIAALPSGAKVEIDAIAEISRRSSCQRRRPASPTGRGGRSGRCPSS